MILRLKRIVQILFLGLFIFIMIKGKAQFWMAFIFFSIILSAFLGRFYCGWACPINTLIQPVAWFSKKLGLQKKQIPKVLLNERIRWAIFSMFIVGLGYTIYTITQGRKFPLPLIIIPLGLITAFFINERAWHRYLCPWGVLFSLTGQFTKRGINASNCVSCRICERHCLGDAIKVEEGKPAVVSHTHCLLCMECTQSCPTGAMAYKVSKQKRV